MIRSIILAWALVLCAAAGFARAQTATDSATRYPIVLSHHWGGSAEGSFRGTTFIPGTPAGEIPFAKWGVKTALERDGAVVYQPNKIDYASNEDRGRLLYRSCKGITLSDRLCQTGSKELEDGVYKAMIEYCMAPALQRGQYTGYADCIARVKMNVICHSQGCLDSRYMINAMTNELSGKQMYEHVASWTSLAGANKGTMLADVALGCANGDCGLDYVNAVTALCGKAATCPNPEQFHDSIVALSRKYVTQTMDMSCDPQKRSCPPSFNQTYQNHPSVYWQTFSAQIRWPHSCYAALIPGWLLVFAYEGANDGYISVESQRLTSAGPGPNQPPTYVHDRGIITGSSKFRGLVHPGLSHMGFSTSRVPGMPGVDCWGLGDDESAYAWDREAFFLQVARELKSFGF